MAGKKSDRNVSNKYRLAGMGMELVAAVLGGCLIGWYIDKRFGTRHGLLIGALIGIVGGMYNLLKRSLKMIKDEQKRFDESKNDVGRDH